MELEQRVMRYWAMWVVEMSPGYIHPNAQVLHDFLVIWMWVVRSKKAIKITQVLILSSWGKRYTFLINEETLGEGVGARKLICWAGSAGKTVKGIQEYQSGTPVRRCGLWCVLVSY